MRHKNQYSIDNPAFIPDNDPKKQNGASVHANDYPEDAEKGKLALEEIEIVEDDPWKVNFINKDYIPWQELNGTNKGKRVLGYIIKSILALGCLYIFICSLDFLSSAFKLLGGEAAGQVFQQSDILTNPIAGVMMGVLVTVLVQSSSTSTSIVVSMVGAHILDIPTAIPIVMGANIGTSVTNTIVSVGQISDKAEFRRAFAGATVHDMFNWLTVIILLPIELLTGYLEHLSGAIVNSLPLETNKGANKDILKVITKPFTDLIIKVDKDAIKKLAKPNVTEEYRIMKICDDKEKPEKCCEKKMPALNGKAGFSWLQTEGIYTSDQMDSVCPELRSCVQRDDATAIPPPGNCSAAWSLQTRQEKTMRLNCTVLGLNVDEITNCNATLAASDWTFTQSTPDANYEQACLNVSSVFTNVNETFSTCMNRTLAWYSTETKVNKTFNEFSCESWVKNVEMKDCNKPSEYLFKPLYDDLGDKEVGAILLVLSLIILCICLVGIVKLLHSLLKGPMAILIKKFINADFPGPLKHLTGYVAILIGAGLTIVVQSSSIFTSTLTPLVGIGVIELDRMYPLTLGSNIGTTTTAILSSLASSGVDLQHSLQVAFCHLFFNITGILIFYPISYLRFPIPMSKFLGNRTANYRWFAVMYILIMFFIFPFFIFALSVAGWYVLAAVLCPLLLLVIIIGIIKVLQAKAPNRLPNKLKNWKFLPEPLRSLHPYDRVMRKIFFCKRFDVKLGSKSDKSNEQVSTAM